MSSRLPATRLDRRHGEGQLGGRNQPNCMCAEREDLKEMSAVGDGPLPIGGSVSSLRELDLLGHPAGGGAAIRARTSEPAGHRRVRRAAVAPDATPGSRQRENASVTTKHLSRHEFSAFLRPTRTARGRSARPQSTSMTKISGSMPKPIECAKRPTMFSPIAKAIVARYEPCQNDSGGRSPDFKSIGNSTR